MGEGDDIGHILTETLPGRFRQDVATWPRDLDEAGVLDRLIEAGWISPMQRPLATYAVRAALDTGLPYREVDLALALDRLGLRIDTLDDPALEAAIALAWARR